MRPTSSLLILIALFTSSAIAQPPPNPATAPAANVRADLNPQRPAITVLSWDTEGGDRQQRNLLRSPIPVSLRIRHAGKTVDVFAIPTPVNGDAHSARYFIERGDLKLLWEIASRGEGLKFTFTSRRVIPGAVELIFPFDPRVTPTTILAANWNDRGFELPAILNAPDFGPMLLTESTGRPVTGLLIGSRPRKLTDLVIQIPTLGPQEVASIEIQPLQIPAPPGAIVPAQWEKARRGWLNAMQPTAEWGDQKNPMSAPGGILGNNVISDPASCSLWYYADHALLLPEPAPGIQLMPIVRRTIDYWLDKRMAKDASGNPTGSVVGYWNYGTFLDANPSILISAWDYIQVTNDDHWLGQRIEQLEQLAEYLAHRDTDNDGLVEALQSGNANTLQQPNRSSNWFDAVNTGHKDAYSNALIYRAWRCLADLDKRLGRTAEQKRYTDLADKLRDAYVPALKNPKTGWIAWWRSADDQLHDYASPFITGMAITFGLVDPKEGRPMLDKLWGVAGKAGFTRFDLGLPCTLLPVKREDYLQPNAIGLPTQPDGSDTFGIYMNGGTCPTHTASYIAACYIVGDNERGDKILNAMLDRQSTGGFQSGVTDEAMKGIDWTTWDGKPAGYEGYVADSYRFLQCVLLRDPAQREKLLGPVMQDPPAE